MKFVLLIVSAFIGSVSAAPAIVWTKDASESVVHSSKSIQASSLVADLVGDAAADSALKSAVFLVGRASDGKESLSALTASGSLPLVASKYNNAAVVHSHVAGIQSPFAMARDVGANTGRRVLEVTLSEFSSKLTSLTEAPKKTEVTVDELGNVSKDAEEVHNRAKALAEADLVIVNVPASIEPSTLDAAVSRAVESKLVGSVVLTAVRSTDEVKLERTMEARRKMVEMEKAGMSSRRRLEQAGDDDNANGDNSDLSGVYYVHMTPNIFAGIMFIMMFTVVTYIGVSCMGMISGQDVYVSKMPSVGREA